MNNADLIRSSLPCSVELPAGTGKTETIAELVKSFADDGKRALVLTHTHAGVDVLRRRMRKLGVPRKAVTIRTLDSWCFDLIARFPTLSGIEVGDEPDWAHHRDYHEAGRRAIATGAVTRMLGASYELVVVDEYQDCQLWQHELVRSIAAVIPTCVLGDRMQGLFFFNDGQPVDWETDVHPAFPPVVIPVVPWRWDKTNRELGEWLLRARTDLMSGRGIDVSTGPVVVRPTAELRDVLFGQPSHPATTVAISRSPPEAARLAQQLGGGYTMIEELEGRHLRAYATVLDTGNSAAITSATIQYAIDCAFGIADKINVAPRRQLGNGRPLDLTTLPQEVRESASRLNRLLQESGATAVRETLIAISRVPGFRLYRREAWFGMLDALRLLEATDGLTALDAVTSIRNKLRFTGRRPESRIVGRALLVKGLEFDNAVVVAPEVYNAHELYVCLTRGARSVTLITDRVVFRPPRPQRS